jgi:hypothetical protein
MLLIGRHQCSIVSVGERDLCMGRVEIYDVDFSSVKKSFWL